MNWNPEIRFCAEIKIETFLNRYNHVNYQLFLSYLMKTTLSFLFALLFLLIASTASAQYEGEINYRIYNPNSGMGEEGHLNITFTQDRIFVDSNIAMNVMAGLQARGILVRNDQDDFVVITTDNEGLKVAKHELENLVTMMNRIQGKPDVSQRPAFDWENKVYESGNTRTIQGKEAHEFILIGDNDGEQISVWLTDRIKVNWGLLLDAWYSTGTTQFDHEIPIEMVMNSHSFPLLVEAQKDYEVVFRAQATSVNSNHFDRSKTELSSNLKLLGLADLMMNFFRQQR